MRTEKLFHRWRQKIAKLSLLIAVIGGGAFSFQAGFYGYHQGLHVGEALAQSQSSQEKAQVHQDTSCEICSILRSSAPGLSKAAVFAVIQPYALLERASTFQMSGLQRIWHAEARAPPRI